MIDVGGGANSEMVSKAFQILVSGFVSFYETSVCGRVLIC